MGLIALIWAPGKRTITVSILFALVSAILQLNEQGAIQLSSMFVIALEMAWAVLLPMVPIFMRKGIEAARLKGIKK